MSSGQRGWHPFWPFEIRQKEESLLCLFHTILQWAVVSVASQLFVLLASNSKKVMPKQQRWEDWVLWHYNLNKLAHISHVWSRPQWVRLIHHSRPVLVESAFHGCNAFAESRQDVCSIGTAFFETWAQFIFCPRVLVVGYELYCVFNFWWSGGHCFLAFLY